MLYVILITQCIVYSPPLQNHKYMYIPFETHTKRTKEHRIKRLRIKDAIGTFIEHYGNVEMRKDHSQLDTCSVQKNIMKERHVLCIICFTLTIKITVKGKFYF